MNASALGSLKATLLAPPMEQAGARPPVLELTTALARGDDAAWAQFHREYGPGIFRQLLGATRGDHDLANEALQQTYLRVARHARPCEAEPMFLAWIRIVARTALSDCRRRRQSFWAMLQRRAGEPEAAGSPEHEEERMQSVIAAALAAVEDSDRALLEAKYFAGESVRTIAERLGVTPKAVESRLTRARVQLRHRVSALLSQDG